MRYILIVCILIFPAFTSAQWTIKYIPSDNFYALEVVNQDTIIVAGDASARIHYSHDGAQSWKGVQTLFAASWFNDMHFPSSSVGYACGGTAFGFYTNVIAKTVDGGISWDSITANSFTGMNFNHIHFTNNDTGFASGEGGLFIKTTDGGTSFTQMPIPNGGTITEIYFESVNNGFIASSKNIGANNVVYSIFKTTDVGVTWTQVYTDTINSPGNLNYRGVNKMQFQNGLNGYATGGNGLFLKTADGGDTWAQSFISPFNNLTAVHFTSLTNGYTNNAGGIYYTSNGGQTWGAQNLNMLSTIYEIEFADDSIGYAIGQSGVYKTTNGGIFTGIDNQSLEEEIRIYPNPTTDKISIKMHSEKITKIEVHNISGKVELRQYSDFEFIDVSHLSNGLYSIWIESKDKRHLKKLVKL